MQKTLGGDRLGSGKKMKVDLHGYERSTHNMDYAWRSTISAGTLVPFLCEVGLPGDTFDIDLGCEVMTHPTVGPLFGSYKVQLDLYQIPIRLYHSALHNNMIGIGMNMSQVKLPKIELTALDLSGITEQEFLDNAQINPSSILAYTGIKGIGYTDSTLARKFHALWILAYWEIVKNYYTNKQEEIGAVIHTPSEAIVTTVTSIRIFTAGSETTIPTGSSGSVSMILGSQIRIYYTGTLPIPSQEIINTIEHGDVTADALSTGIWTDTGTYMWSPFRQTTWGNTTAQNWRYTDDTDINTGKPGISTFDLTNIDDMRTAILAADPLTEFVINTPGIEPYSFIYGQPNGIPNILSSQEGLALKTYQSDMFNNWLQTEWIDGTGGISEITAIDTSSGNFTIDTFILANKIYKLLNRIMVSGGSYNDWQDAVWAHQRYTQSESPMYIGGLIKELVFQQVISNSASDDQPLGTLAGRGAMAQKHKGGSVIARIDEPSILMGIASLTPRIDYSQGNRWDTYSLDTLDDLHKPQLDEIGFQELITEQLAWWDTTNIAGTWTQKSAGKQPAWLNYMTTTNRTYGNFAILDNEMFMTLNRRYEMDFGTTSIKDLTTYIDPSKFNFIFAETALDAQNFWMQIGVGMTARRKMSAKLMPNI